MEVMTTNFVDADGDGIGDRLERRRNPRLGTGLQGTMMRGKHRSSTFVNTTSASGSDSASGSSGGPTGSGDDAAGSRSCRCGKHRGGG
jgi:hypothetical protein